jgi:putative membrane protein
MSGIFPGGIFHLLLWALMLLALVYLIFRLIRSLKSNHTSNIRDRMDSFEILRARFAKGELSEEQYAKMKNVLLQS